jgi:uncharacterized membrane protein YphA (DoxX/SURF4 family)
MEKQRRSKKLWIMKAILFVAFMFFGIAKLFISPEDTVQVFGSIGGSTAQYFTGVYQILSAILVVIPQTAFLGALFIAISMFVAILLHFTVIGFEGPLLVVGILAFVFLLISIFVMKKTRRDLFRKR